MKKAAILLAILLGLLAVPVAAPAQVPEDVAEFGGFSDDGPPTIGGLLNDAGKAAGFNEDPDETQFAKAVAGFIRIITAMVGVFFAVMLVYGGYLWLLSGGNEESISRGKRVVATATMGMLLMLLAFFIADFVVNRFSAATLDGGA